MMSKENLFFVISGLSGFIGSELKEYLENENLQYFYLKTNKNQVGYTNIINNFPESRTPVFIHLSGISSVRDCELDVEKAIDYNVNLVSESLKICQLNNIQKFIFLSTAFLYGDNEEKLHLESDNCSVSNVYLSTKMLAEKLIENFSNKHNINSTVLRLSNVFSLNSKENTVLGSILKQVNERANPIEVFNINSERDFVHVKDVITAIIKVSESNLKDDFSIFNIGTGVKSSVLNLIEGLTSDIEDYSPEIKELYPLDRKSVLGVEIGKIKSILKWEPVYSLQNSFKSILK